MTDLAPDDAVEGVIVEPEPPTTRVRLLDIAGAEIYRASFPAGSWWAMDLWAIGGQYGRPAKIEVEEAP